MSCAALITIIIAFLNFSNAATYYTVPKPRIEVLRPKGLRISIPDAPGVAMFAFHGNINSDLNYLDDGLLSGNIFTPTDGRWVYENKDVQLKNGDYINYWMFVMSGRLGYRVEGQRYIVKDLSYEPTLPIEEKGMLPFDKEELYKLQSQVEAVRLTVQHLLSTTTNDLPIPPSNTPTPSTTHPPDNCLENTATTKPCNNYPNYEPALTYMVQTIVNLTNSNMELLSKIESLDRNLQDLQLVVEKYPDSKKLVMEGLLPPDDENSVMTVSFFLQEKLGLSPHITFASRIAVNLIVFEVSSLSEKQAVLESARKHLKNSRVSITSYLK